MTFEYARFTEEWASIYKPMLHKRKNERFFICDSYNNMTNFMEQMDPNHSPCVIVESQQEGSIREGKDYPRYTWYFMVRAGETHEGFRALRAKGMAKDVMIDFVNFLRAFKHEDMRDVLMKFQFEEGSYLWDLREEVINGGSCLDNINIDDIYYESLNEMYDTWYGVTISLDDIQLFDMCADISMYEN